MKSPVHKAEVERMADDEIRELAAWYRSRRYDIARDAMVTNIPPPSFISRLDDATRLHAAMTIVDAPPA